MCFGVRDAIALALRQSKSGPLSILGDLVHNETVLQDLRSKGVKIEHQAADISSHRVMITAHGAPDRTLQALQARGLQVLEATCPLVHHAHRAVAALVAAGYHPVIIGKRDHVEVRGLTGDLAAFDVVLSAEDVLQLPEYPRYGVACQTTQPIERVKHLLGLIEERFPKSEVRFVDTVCQPTKQRQTAAVDLSKQSDVVIVIGGAHSNNTQELVRTCSGHCRRVHHVQSARDLKLEWFRNADTIGITAGTSTPDRTIDEVEQWLRDHMETVNEGVPPIAA
jgi:4-hydroxy-3-methylbut-2-enyl diphosphate reductase